MQITVYISATLRTFVNRRTQVTLEGNDISDILERLKEEYPQVKDALFDDAGELREFVSIYLNEENVSDKEKWNTSLTEKDELKKINYIDPCISCYADKVLLGNSYVIKGASKAYGGYEIAVAVETFEPAYVSEKINSIMKEDILEKKGTEISERLLKNGIVTELSTEEEIIAALYKGASEEAIPTIESQIEAAKKIKEDYVLYIVEKDGRLLVDITRSTAFFAISTDVFKIY